VDVLARSATHEIIGRVDRLAITPEAVLIADFNTGAPSADAATAPLNYVRQLALYSDVLARVYPGKAMRALLVWTAGAAGPAIHKIEDAALKSVLVKASPANTGP
jgi:ATP-dependent helicase/nuclease subunit A